MASLNVVALISGGKDSFFSILHCRANGHKVVALANLHPQAQDEEDLDSFMYQTIGHSIIPLYEQAIGLPLYRQAIHGTAAVQDRDYHHAGDADETESLLPLLRKVLEMHPEVNAVSTGAILSDYQRTRVESVALRLGLTPLSYLWQWPTLPPQTQTSLLEDMAAVGQDSRIIKVASGGLDETFLWQNVADMRTRSRLNKAAERFGTSGDGAVLGEGGEFETLAVDGPAPLWKGSIIVSPEDVAIVPGEAGSASVRLRNATVRPKEDAAFQSSEEQTVRMPPLLDDRFEQILQSIQSASLGEPSEISSFQAPLSSRSLFRDPMQLLEIVVGQGTTAAGQTKAIMDEIVARLAQSGLTVDDIANVTIVLRNMDDFTAVNPIYGSYFSRPNPPSRVTVACADVLPDNALLSISVAAAKGKRQGLHVQSRSYWAPANIGPYSQAIRLHQLGDEGAGSVYVAGQIPLIAGSMQLPQRVSEKDDGFTLQSVLSLQHLDRIARVMKIKHWTHCIVFIAATNHTDEDLSRRAKIARRAWDQYHTPVLPTISTDETDADDENFDVWHQQHGSARNAWATYSDAKSREDPRSQPDTNTPQLVLVSADALPRGAAVEWVPYSDAIAQKRDGLPAHLANILRMFRHRVLP